MTGPLLPSGFIASSAWPASAAALTSGLAALEAHVPESNSLYEYVAWKVFATAKLASGTAAIDRLMVLFSRPHSLNDLVDFTESERLRPTPSFTDACRLGEGFFRDTFAEALARPEMRGSVRSALSRIAAGRLPDVMSHRLFHVLLSGDHEYKTAEFLHFSWDQKTTSVQPACVPHPEVKRAIAAVEAIVSQTTKDDLVARWKVWRKCLKKDERQFALDLETSLSALVPGVRILWKSADEMKRFSRRHPAENADNIVADFVLPAETGGPPAVVLLAPAPSRLVLEARARHEATHLKQALAFGGEWVHRNLLIAEMWAYGVETRHRLDCGDASLYLEIRKYSPFGFGLALRNFTEHMNLRQAAPL